MRLENECVRTIRTRYSDIEDRRTDLNCDLKMCHSSTGSPYTARVFPDRCRRTPDSCPNRPKMCTFYSALGRVVQSYSAVIFYLFIICFINIVGCSPAGSYSSTDWYRQQEDKAVVSYPPLLLFIATFLLLKSPNARKND